MPKLSMQHGSATVPDRSSRLQYYSIAEQILLSASNMVASVVVVKSAGVEWFGIYSFMFVLTVFTSAFFASLLHGQMMLEISAKPAEERKSTLLATLIMQTFFLVCLLLLGWVVLALLTENQIVQKYQSEIIVSALFVVVFNFYELFKQYLYVIDNQAYSLRCTVVYVTVLFSMFLFIYLNVPPENVTQWIFGAFSLSLLCGLAVNWVCLDALIKGKWIGIGSTYCIFKTYFSHGRFSLVSMLITWIQNQSMSPVLMWLSGPLVVGYFNIARLLIMPMSVINTGLTKSSTPTLRRAFKGEGGARLAHLIASLNRKNMLFALLYLAALCVLHITGVLHLLVPSYSDVELYLLIWIGISLVTMYRAWQSQYFIISMQFQFLLRVSVAALLVTFIGVIGVGYGLKNIQLALVFVAVGELTSIYLFRREHASYGLKSE